MSEDLLKIAAEWLKWQRDHPREDEPETVALARGYVELHQEIDDLIGPHCSSCAMPIDPNTCHCGDYLEGHGGYDSHAFVPMGCCCGYEPDWKALAKSRAEYLHQVCRERDEILKASGKLEAELRAAQPGARLTDEEREALRWLVGWFDCHGTKPPEMEERVMAVLDKLLAQGGG